VKRTNLSPVTTLLVSLSLVIGILVCDLTGLHAFPAASAQTGAAHSDSISVSAAMVEGSVIAARGVVINGVAVDAVFLGGVRVSKSVVESGDGVYVLGAYPSGGPGSDTEDAGGAYPSGIAPPDAGGAYPSGIVPPDVNGAYPSGGPESGGTENDGAYPSGVIYGGGLEVVGGTLQGSNIQVTNGVISGDNLVLVGAYVTSSGAR
jgi:hypothetical protein